MFTGSVPSPAISARVPKVSLTSETLQGGLEVRVWKPRVLYPFRTSKLASVNNWEVVACVSVSKSNAQGKQHELITWLVKVGDLERWGADTSDLCFQALVVIRERI